MMASMVLSCFPVDCWCPLPLLVAGSGPCLIRGVRGGEAISKILININYFYIIRSARQIVSTRSQWHRADRGVSGLQGENLGRPLCRHGVARGKGLSL